MKIHADDCPFVCSTWLSSCQKHDLHVCRCHAQQALDELVRAAKVVDEDDAINQGLRSVQRLESALKPFLERAHPSITRDSLAKP